jgi:hypothetical protein
MPLPRDTQTGGSSPGGVGDRRRQLGTLTDLRRAACHRRQWRGGVRLHLCGLLAAVELQGSLPVDELGRLQLDKRIRSQSTGSHACA